MQRNKIEIKFTPARYEMYSDICIKINKKIQGVLHIDGCFSYHPYILRNLLQLGRKFTPTFGFELLFQYSTQRLTRKYF